MLTQHEHDSSVKWFIIKFGNFVGYITNVIVQ